MVVVASTTTMVMRENYIIVAYDNDDVKYITLTICIHDRYLHSDEKSALETVAVLLACSRLNSAMIEL